MNAWTVLVVDDDPEVREIIRLYFDQQHIGMVEAQDGVEALELIEREPPDLIILDVMMPRMDGFELCRELMRRSIHIPIIILTGRNDEIDRVLGLELGADDYMTKPFSPRELVARIKAIFRRMQLSRIEGAPALPLAFEFDGLSIRTDRREVVAGEHEIPLRPKEFDLLTHLARMPGTVFTREQLLEQVWGYDFIGDIRTVDVHIKKLREKVYPHKSDCIQTVWGVGYKFLPEG